MDNVDFDLMPWAPRSFKIRGATGEVYRVEEWLPLRVMLRISQLTALHVDKLREIENDDLFDEAGLSDATDKLEEVGNIYAAIQRIVLVVLRHQYKDLDLETVKADFPREGSLQFLDFLFERFWYARFRDLNPQSRQMPGTEETSKPKRSERKIAPLPIRQTGS